MLKTTELSADIIESPAGPLVKLRVQNCDAELIGQKAALGLFAKFETKPGSIVEDYIKKEKILWGEDILVTKKSMIFEVPLSEYLAFNYDGFAISIKVVARLDTDRLLDSEFVWRGRAVIETNVPISISRKQQDVKASKKLLEIPDEIDSKENWSAVDPSGMKRISIFSGVYAAIIISAALICFSLFLIYKENELTELSGFMIFGAIGIFVLASRHHKKAREKALKSYANLYPKLILTSSANSCDKIPVSKIFDGRTKIDISKTRIRIVAYNSEKIKYQKQEGRHAEYIELDNCVRCVCLYDKNLSIKKDIDISSQILDHVSLYPIFDFLYPSIDFDSHNGLYLEWEIQLINPYFKDIRVKGTTGTLSFPDFVVEN